MSTISLRGILKSAIKDWVHRESPRIRPSTLGGCIRKNYFSIVENTIVETEELQMVVGSGSNSEVSDIVDGYLATGKLFELFLTPHFQRQGFLHQCLIIIDPSSNLYGHSDFYKYDEESKTGYIVDIKTTSYHHFDFLPNEAHVAQVQLYMHGALYGEIWRTGENGEPVERLPNPEKCVGGLLYIARENAALTSEKQEHWFPYNPRLVEEILQNKAKLSEAIAKGEPPPIPPHYTPYSFPCLFITVGESVICPYWDRCWLSSVSDIGEETLKNITEMVKRFVRYKEAEREWEEYRKVFIECTSATPQVRVTTPLGVVEKTTQVRSRENAKRMVNLLIEEGKLSPEEAWDYYERSKSNYEAVVVKVYPNWTAFQQEEEGREENGNE